mgnify:CR=1 FL=1
MIDGILNVYKEQDYTSFDVVAKLRGILKQKKIGHTGTLDPMAEGVLLVCLGKATKLVDLLTEGDKCYRATMKLGYETDTEDVTGETTAEGDAAVLAQLTQADVKRAILSFIGKYDQIPPMYSALKHNGKKLYELARQGIEVERKARRINISSIHVNELNLEDKVKTVTFTVECSKGTYIRTLCEDIGNKLGCGACMQSLKRTRVGLFGTDTSYTLSQLQELADNSKIEDVIIAVDNMFPDYPKVTVCEGFDKLLYNGNKLPEKAIIGEIGDNKEVRLYNNSQEFIGIYKYEKGEFIPVKIFYES